MAELMIYMVLMAITPGPNTILSLANSSQKGIRKGIYLNYGMLLGIAIVDTVVFFLIYYLNRFLPALNPILQVLGIAYMIYIAISLLRKGTVSLSNGSGDFKTGLLMQLMNMKMMLLCVSAISTYILPMQLSLLEEYIISLIIPINCFLCGLVWALCGAAMKNVYSKHGKALNIVFSTSLFILALKNIWDLIQNYIIKG